MLPLPRVNVLTYSLIVEGRPVRERLSKRGAATDSRLHQATGARSSIAIFAASVTTSSTLCKNVASVGHPRLKQQRWESLGPALLGRFQTDFYLLSKNHSPLPPLLLLERTSVLEYFKEFGPYECTNSSPNPVLR